MSDQGFAKAEAATAMQLPLSALAHVPQIYANSIGLGGTATDLTITFLHLPRPIAAVTMPYSLAKSLAEALQATISGHEKRTGSEVPSLEALSKQIDSYQQRNEP